MFRVVSAAAVFTAALVACLAGHGAASSVIPAPPNLLQNGGFEQPSVGAGSYTLVATGQSVPGWRVVGAAGNVAPISGSFTQSGIHFVAQSGKQWLDLTGVSNSRTGVAQTVKTSPDTSYSLSFWVGNVFDPGGIFGISSTVDVLVNGQRVMAATNPGGRNTHDQVWKRFALTIKATSGTTTVEFLNGDPSTDNSNGLDAVTLT